MAGPWVASKAGASVAPRASQWVETDEPWAVPRVALEATMAEKKVASTAASRAFLLAPPWVAVWAAALGCRGGKKAAPTV